MGGGGLLCPADAIATNNSKLHQPQCGPMRRTGPRQPRRSARGAQHLRLKRPQTSQRLPLRAFAGHTRGRRFSGHARGCRCSGQASSELSSGKAFGLSSGADEGEPIRQARRGAPRARRRPRRSEAGERASWNYLGRASPDAWLPGARRPQLSVSRLSPLPAVMTSSTPTSTPAAAEARRVPQRRAAELMQQLGASCESRPPSGAGSLAPAGSLAGRQRERRTSACLQTSVLALLLP
jgi:hypothetical protein